MAYLIKKNKKTNEIIYMEYDLHGYKFSPKSKKEAYLDVKEVTVINPELIDSILSIKFNKIFNKLFNKVVDVLNDDASESDTMMVLGEVELLRGILLNKYQNFLKFEKEELFLKKLRLLENELKVKIMMIREKRLAMEEELEVSKGKGL